MSQFLVETDSLKLTEERLCKLAGRVREIREHFVGVYKAVNWEVKGQQQLDRKMADIVTEMGGISNTLSKTGDTLGRIEGEYLAACSEGKKLVEGLQTDLTGIGTTKPGIPPAQDSRSSKDVPTETPVTGNTGLNQKDTVPGTVNDSIISNLREYEGFGYKKDAMIKAAEALLNEGYEPAFVAGLLANIKYEGSPGVFEKSNYGSLKLLSNDKDNGRYLDYEESRDNYKRKGAYLIYMDQFTNYSKEFSGKTISEVGLDKLNELLKDMEKTGAQSVVAGKWEKGKFLGYYDKKTSGGFGAGMIQWTFGRAKGLIEYYNTKKFEKDGFPTQEECLETEIEYMIKELKSDSYKGIYGDGEKYDSNNKDAAYNAGHEICSHYEIPNETEKKADVRGTYAKEVYEIMMGSK
ncbi:MAG TPA: phage tail tip lysozyme [Ruminiclostridium sp.]|nr:phage tail tip lysozyme [Ruminiclostridium sp.]